MTFASVSEGGGSVSHPRLLIVAGEASQATVLERYVGTGAAFTNAVGEVWLGANAVIDHYKLQEEPADSFHIASMFLHCARSGTFSSHSLTFGGGLVRNDVVAALDGEGIDCTLNGLYVGRGKQLIDNHTTIDHAMPHCGSHEIYKGILGDSRARSSTARSSSGPTRRRPTPSRPTRRCCCRTKRTSTRSPSSRFSPTT